MNTRTLLHTIAQNLKAGLDDTTLSSRTGLTHLFSKTDGIRVSRQRQPQPTSQHDRLAQKRGEEIAIGLFETLSNRLRDNGLMTQQDEITLAVTHQSEQDLFAFYIDEINLHGRKIKSLNGMAKILDTTLNILKHVPRTQISHPATRFLFRGSLKTLHAHSAGQAMAKQFLLTEPKAFLNGEAQKFWPGEPMAMPDIAQVMAETKTLQQDIRNVRTARQKPAIDA